MPEEKPARGDSIISHNLGSSFLSLLEEHGLTKEDVQKVLDEHPRIAAPTIVEVAKRASVVREMIRAIVEEGGEFNLAQFRSKASELINQLFRSDLPKLGDFDPETAIRKFKKSIEQCESLDQLVRAATVELLDPISTALIGYYEQYSFTVSVGDKPDRRNYERVYFVVREILCGLAKGLSKPEPVLPDLDHPCDAEPVEIAFGGEGRVRVIRKGQDQDRPYIMWVKQPGRQDKDGKVIEKAEVIAW